MQLTTDSGNFSIRPYEPADEAAVLRAWEASFNKPLAPESWRWKYHGAPFGHKIMLCVHESGDVAAMYGGVIYPVLWQRQTRNFCQLMDNLSNPSYRGVLGGRNGVFVKTARAMFTDYSTFPGCTWLYGLPGRRHYRLGEQLLGYLPVPGGMPRLVVDTKKLNITRRPLLAGQTRRIDPSHLRGLARLSDGQSRSGRLMARRDAEFFRWRFMQHPAKRYQAWSFRPAFRQGWSGYAVVSIQEQEAVMVDTLLPDRHHQVATFIGAIAEELQQVGVHTLLTWLPAAANEISQLVAIGFSKHADPLGIIPAVRPIAKDLEWEKPDASFYFTMADSDLF